VAAVLLEYNDHKFNRVNVELWEKGKSFGIYESLPGAAVTGPRKIVFALLSLDPKKKTKDGYVKEPTFLLMDSDGTRTFTYPQSLKKGGENAVLQYFERSLTRPVVAREGSRVAVWAYGASQKQAPPGDEPLVEFARRSDWAVVLYLTVQSEKK
jgi:hypothetical protein